MDADFLLIAPKQLYSLRSDSDYEAVSLFEKEIEDFLKYGKNIFVFLSEKVSYGEFDNYSFLPINMGALTSAKGERINFSGNSIFTEFYKAFKKSHLNYQLYVEKTDGSNPSEVIFTGTDQSKILGAVYKVEKGNIVTLPYLNHNYYKQFSGWTDDAQKFGDRLKGCLLSIDKQLSEKTEKTPTPEWSDQEEFSLTKAIEIEEEIQKNNHKIEELNLKNNELNKKLAKANGLKDLLFEQGTPLENAVINALNRLGYDAKNHRDGECEFDVLGSCPENYRFIGECEGKDKKAIEISKIRQLSDNLIQAYENKIVDEMPFGILFGNPERLNDPKKRTVDFTQQCKKVATINKIALVKTVDLFAVVKYLDENEDELFKQACRQAIFDGRGKQVKFPEIPAMTSRVFGFAP